MRTNKRCLGRDFFLSALKSPFDVGAICSSSQSLASCIVDASLLQPSENIVELGAGTGVITREINRRLPIDCNFISVEKDPNLAKIAREQFNGAVEVIDSDIRDIATGKLGSVDCLISSLPMTLWTNSLQIEVIAGIRSHMADSGRMIFFSYLTSNLFGGKNKLLANLRTQFKKIEEHSVVWSNTPPAKIYTCSDN